MKHSDIRRVVFITDTEKLEDQPDFVQYIKENNGVMLSAHKCEEGFVCLVSFEGCDLVVLDEGKSIDSCESTSVLVPDCLVVEQG